MLYSKIKNTDITASKLVLGSDRFGTAISEKESFSILDRFVEAGGNMIDTASFYANWLSGNSVSEKTIGKWLEERGCRDKIVISTKGGHFNLETPDISRMSKEEMKADFEASLENLRTDYIDVYWYHKDDKSISPEELIENLNEVTNGRARYIAASNWPCDRLIKANEYAIKNSLRPFIAGQIQYSIARINEEFIGPDIFVMTDSEYEKYKNSGLNVFGFSTQAKGFFIMAAEGGIESVPDGVKAEFLNDYNMKLLEKLKKLAKEKNVSIPALVPAVLTSDEEVPTFAQIGPQTVGQLDSSLEAADLKLTKEERDYLLNDM